jgi:hypothetical protein
VVRLATLPLPGHHDVLTWKIWSYAASRDVTAMYGVGGNPPTRGVLAWQGQETTVDYPPFFLYEYSIVGRVYRLLFRKYPNTVALLVAVKLPVLLANVALTALLFSLVRTISSRGAARWCALAYWLNPATILGGEMLGYVEPLFTLPAIGGLALAGRGYFSWAGILVAVAIATKPQALLIGPAFALLVWQSGRLRACAASAAAGAATLAAIGLPFYVRGALPNMWLAFGSFYERRDTMSTYAANIGWIINWALRARMGLGELGFPRAFLQIVPVPLSITRFHELGYPNPRPLGAAAVVAVALWAIWLARRTRSLSIAAALGALTVHAYFVLSPGMHESHQLFEIPLLALAAASQSRFRALYLTVSAIVALNINYLYGIGIGWGWAVPRTITVIDLSVVLAFVNVGALVWFAFLFQREVRTSQVDEQKHTAVALGR